MKRLMVCSLVSIIALKIHAQNDLEKLVLSLSDSIKANKGNISTIYQMRASAYLALGQYENAISDANELIKTGEVGEWYYLKGAALVELENYGEAINQLNYAIDLSPDSVIYYVYRGIALRELGEFEDSKVNFMKALNMSGYEELIYVNLAILYEKTDEQQLAKSYWDKAIDQFPWSRNFHNRGLFFMEYEEYELAKNDFVMSIKLDASNTQSMIMLAYVYALLGKYEDSEKQFLHGIKAGGANDPYLYFYRAKSRILSEQLTKACQDYKKARKLGLSELIIECE